MKSTVRELVRVANRAPVPLAPRSLRLPGFSLANTTQAQMAAYGGVGTLFAIVHGLSEATSQVGWCLYRTTVDGRRRYGAQEERAKVTRHAALDLWRRPNAWQTGMEFREQTVQYLDLTGKSFWVIARAPGISLPLELWAIRPDRMTPVPHPEKFLSGFVYTGPGGEQVPLQPEDVIWMKYPHPTDPYDGLGPVQTILTDLDATSQAAAWNRNFFANSAEPGGIIEFPERLTEPEFNEFTERWREQHQGVANAHRVAILERGTWKDRVISQRDMQFVELRKLSREVIREAFAMHAHRLGVSEDVNKANAEAADVSFGKWLVRPRLQRIREIANARLLPLYGATTAGLEFDHDDPEPPDREANDRERTSKVEAFVALIGAGVDTADAAAVCGLPEMAVTAPPAADGDGQGGDQDQGDPSAVSPRELIEMVQKVYLGVDKVVTWDEARDILNRAGANLPDEPQPPPPAPPAPPQPAEE